MKMRLFLVGTAAWLLSGCTMLFESNLFSSFDVPPPAKVDGLSASDLNNKINDKDFVTQLKNDPAALAKVQANLQESMKNATTNAAKAEAAQAYVALTYQSDAKLLPVVNNAVGAILPLVKDTDGISKLGTDGTQLQSTANSLFKGMTADEVKNTLINMNNVSGAMVTLKSSTTSTDDFYGDTTKGDMAQVGLVSGSIAALMTSTGQDLTTTEGKEAAATIVQGLLVAENPTDYINNPANFPTSDPSKSLSTQFSDLGNAFNGTPGENNPYAYVTDLKSAVPGMDSTTTTP